MRGERDFQYLADIDGLAGEPVFDFEPREDEDASVLGLHDTNLFDQNEDRSGELIDPATGLPYDNSTFPETEGLTVVAEDELDQADQADVADVWLARYDQLDIQNTAEAS